MPAALWQWAPLIYGSVNANSHCPYSEKKGGQAGGEDGGRRGLLDACPRNMILSSEVSGPIPQALSSVPPSSRPTIRLLSGSRSSPSPRSIEHYFLISAGFKGLQGHGVSSFVHADCCLYGQPIVSIVLPYYHGPSLLSVEVYVHKAAAQGLKTIND